VGGIACIDIDDVNIIVLNKQGSSEPFLQSIGKNQED